MTEINIPKNTALPMILGGYGNRKNPKNIAVHAANTTTWDTLIKTCPHTLIKTSGKSVGLPEGQTSNSEVGHMNLRTGHVGYQNLSKVDRDISSGRFFKNRALLTAINEKIINNSTVHILRLLSPGGIHTHDNQISALIDLAIEKKNPPSSYSCVPCRRRHPSAQCFTITYLGYKKITITNKGGIASISGRFFAMDRDNRWDRIEPVNNMLIHGDAIFQFGAQKIALKAADARGEDDEFVQPTISCDEKNPPTPTKRSDSVISMNFRSDQLTKV